MNRYSLIALTAFLLISTLILSKTIIFAEDIYIVNLSKYEENCLEFSSKTAGIDVCEYVEDKSVYKDEDIEPYMKDRAFTLAFIDSGKRSEMTLEEYLICVVMAEIPYTFDLEAIKAQAVAARSYTVRSIYTANRHDGGALCSSSAHCSAYLSKTEFINKYGEEAYEKAYTKIKKAINDTDGEIITYNAEPCCAVYHSASNGKTENSYNLWGTKTPYLMSVESYENDKPDIVAISESRMKLLLSGYKDYNSSNQGIKITYNDSGRCDTVTINGVCLTGTKARSLFGLKSCDFDLTYNQGEYVFTVFGYGHGIGMSQYGANAMAVDGMSYTDILFHYYTGVELDYIN